MAAHFPSQHTCLSAHPHNDNIRDIITHYIGCIEIGDRTGFFNLEQRHWRIELGRMVDAGIRKLPGSTQALLSPPQCARWYL